MRRLMVLIGVLVLVTACGHKNVRVVAPTTAPSAAVPKASELEGIASYYAEPYNGRATASGEIFDSYGAKTAAHKTLPFNTVVRVTNLNNGKEVDVKINDRGPFIEGRVIDLSLLAARDIDLERSGIAPVKLKILKEGLPASRAVGAVAGPVYAVQVAAFEVESAADALRDKLEKRYSQVSIETVSVQKTFYRVRVGRAPDLDTAEKLARQLRNDDFKPFVVRLN